VGAGPSSIYRVHMENLTGRRRKYRGMVTGDGYNGRDGS